MRLPTVTVRDRRKNRIVVFNAAEYAARGLWADPRFEIVRQSGGDASDAETAHRLGQALKEDARQAVPGHPAAGDRRRAYEFRQGRPVIGSQASTVTEGGEGPFTTAEAAAGADPPEPPPAEDWRSMPWFALRRRVRDLTGVLPDSKKHAEQLMAEHEASQDRP